MYKLLLVDDEADVREGLLQEIEWARWGFEVADTAENGREAMELIERLEPDVVMTDISMPFMDGLALADWIRAAHPATRIVLLSGYDEFEYAQRAINLGVDEYVLKPFDAGQIAEVLRKVKNRIDEEIARREDMELLREHYRTSLPVLRETFLASLLSRKLPVRQIEETAGGYGIRLDGRSYIVSAASLAPSAETQGMAADQGRAAGSLFESGDIELQLFAVLNVAEELWTKYEMGRAFIYQNHVVLLTICREAEADGGLRRTLAVLQETVQSIERFLKLSVFVGVGSPVESLTELKYGYEDALHALDYHVIQSNTPVIYIGDVERRFANKLRFDELKEHELIRCMKIGTPEELRGIADRLFDEAEHAKASYSEYQVYVMELLTAVLKAAKDAEADLGELFGGSGVFLERVQKPGSLTAAKEWFAEMCAKVMRHIASSRQHTYKQLVQEAIDYTMAHYADSDISVQRVCGHLHISSGYFSSVFKKETKTTFVAYLMNVRMEAAKRLLQTTELKAFEIAERVGFSDPNYFSFCFKKQVGLSPKEYRNRPKEE